MVNNAQWSMEFNIDTLLVSHVMQWEENSSQRSDASTPSEGKVSSFPSPLNGEGFAELMPLCSLLMLLCKGFCRTYASVARVLLSSCMCGKGLDHLDGKGSVKLTPLCSVLSC